MKILPSRTIWILLLVVTLATMFVYTHDAFGSRYSYKEIAVPELIKLSPRLQRLFAETKLVCIGRYALEVPAEAQLIHGSISIPSKVEIFESDVSGMKIRATASLARLKYEDETMEVVYNGVGPIAHSWQTKYFPKESSKERGWLMYDTYIHKGNHIFMMGDVVQPEEKDDASVEERQRSFANRLRLRDKDEVPRDPGFCIPHAFIAESAYDDQEMTHGGIFIPSFPDVSFSISSNKDAYGDYPKKQFDEEQRAKLSLIARINEAKKDQPLTYPSHTLLRQGKRDVHHWHGEESLIKRKDGSHDFEWALVGTPRDVANPSEFNAVMYSKVEHNKVGAAREASLSDDEAVALFDRLLAGFKFRVQVPGAPEGSYYFPVDPTAPITPLPTAKQQR